MRVFVTSIGQDSHRFCREDEPGSEQRCLRLGGLDFFGEAPLKGNSDADVILHAVTNALSGLTGKPVLGKRADDLCRSGERDSAAYLRLALEDLREDPRRYRLLHLSLSLEGQRPRIAERSDEICQSLAALLGLSPDEVALTATSGEGLTAFGRGEGIQVLALLSASRDERILP